VWVDVSNFDVQVIVRNILQQLITTGYKGESFQQDLDLLHQNLNGTRYLLVLDDVWNVSREKWTHLASHLMCGAKGVRFY
jgi:leucine-rich repeat protein SHOC2